MDIIPGTRRNATVKYVLSADLGQSADPTATCALEHTHAFREYARGGADQFEDTFDVRHLARLPLGMPYPDQVAEIARLAARPPLVGCEVIFDQTGVGAAVCDIADSAGFRPTRVVITAGSEQTFVNGAWHVPKATLISILDARLHLGELRFAAELLEAGAMREELKDFKRKVSASGRFQYEARTTRHDDLVLAVAIGLWALVGRPKMPGPSFGTWGRSVPSNHLVQSNADEFWRMLDQQKET
jgi:hypothetical protein